MNAVLEKFGLTALVTLVTIMFVTLFAGYTVLGYAAIAAFTGIGVVMIAQQMVEA